MQQLEFVVPQEACDQRLDSYLAAQEETGLSRSALQQLVKDGKVLCNGKPASKNARLRPGQPAGFLAAGPPSPRQARRQRRIARPALRADRFLQPHNPAGFGHQDDGVARLDMVGTERNDDRFVAHQNGHQHAFLNVQAA